MIVMQVLAVYKKAQKGPPGPKAVEKTWVQNLTLLSLSQILNPKSFHTAFDPGGPFWAFFFTYAEFPNIVHFLFLLKPSFTCVITEEIFFGNVTTLLFWQCDRYWYEENCFLAMWQPIFFLAMCLFGDVIRVRFWRRDPSPLDLHYWNFK